MPSYAQRTGRRLLLQPALFRKGPGPRFTVAARRYEPAAGVSEDGRTLVYTRRFYFGQGGDQQLRFPVDSSASLKGYFDEVNKHGGRTIALRQAAAAESK